MKYDNQLRYASDIIGKYDGKIPLSAWLKDFFRLNKQMGSSDRRTVSEMVYGFYRLGHNLPKPIEDRILWFILHSENIPFVKEYFSQKISERNYEFDNDRIFPFKKFLSQGINENEYSSSFLVQPNLFIRIRPGYAKTVLDKLHLHDIPFKECGDDCIELANATKVEQLLELDKEAVVQDKSSQETGRFIADAAKMMPSNPAVWDCCSASGGKSIMAHDLLKRLQLTVSDKREAIMQNLRKRFTTAGIHQYTSFVADLVDMQTKIPSGEYDLVIADVPCSGSGTWARTPEQLYFFKEESIAYYSGLQKRIVSKVIPSVKPDGLLLYITCSVFADENEENASYFEEKLNLKMIDAALIRGYDQKADTLYAALFTNRSA